MKKITGSWKVITTLRECPVCKSRYDTSVNTCLKDGSALTQMTVTTYPCPSPDGQRELLAELKLSAKGAALIGDVRKLYKYHIKIADYHKRQNQLTEALTHYQRAELLSGKTPEKTQLPAIIEICLLQSRPKKALDLIGYYSKTFVRNYRPEQVALFLRRVIAVQPANLEWEKQVFAAIHKVGLADALLLESIFSKELFQSGELFPLVSEQVLPEETATLISDEDLTPIEDEGDEFKTGERARTGSLVATPTALSNTSPLTPEQKRIDSSLLTAGEFRNLRTTSSFRVTDSGRMTFPEQTVMVVDDEPGIRELLGELLSEFECHVINCIDGEDAIGQLQKTRPSFIISDVMMPRRNGYELFEYIRKQESLNDIPFIFLTARGDIDEKLKALEQGVEDYWSKPFDVEEILIRIKRVLQKVRIAGDVRGKLSEIPLPDLLQTLSSGNKSGTLHLSHGGRAGVIYLDQGKVIDAEFEDLVGKWAIYSLINWFANGGSFNFHSQKIDRTVMIKQTIQGILLEAVRRRDEEQRLIEQLPDGDVYMTVNVEESTDFFFSDFSDEATRILQLFDGTHTLKECLKCLQGDLETIQTVVALNKAGLLRIVDFGIH
ncbi:MAG: response regulator [Blastocatellia bacterium]|nr:response regulator [Blastocatellia bacterium]